jgi:phosphoribosyl 1,2-cyclic phosphodiesterase
MKFCMLASGSRGNAVWVEEGGSACLVDNGLPLKEFTLRARRAGLNTEKLTTIFVTHEHGDHLNGVGPLARSLNLEVYCSPRLLDLKNSFIGPINYRPISGGETVTVGPFTAEAILSSHDTVDPLIYVIRGGGASLGIATDLGFVPKLVAHGFRDLDGMVLEFNHDQTMLLNGTYPAFLKQRVRSRKGHLSNEQAGEFLASVCHEGLKVVVLAHLSEKNNTPELALEAAREYVGKSPGKPHIHVADQYVPTPIFDVPGRLLF